MTSGFLCVCLCVSVCVCVCVSVLVFFKTTGYSYICVVFMYFVCFFGLSSVFPVCVRASACVCVCVVVVCVAVCLLKEDQSIIECDNEEMKGLR